MKIFAVGEIDNLEIGGMGMKTHSIRVVASPEAAAKILCTQPRMELTYNDDQTEGQIIEVLRSGKSASAKWRYTEQRDKRTTFVLAAYPKELEGGDKLIAAALEERDLAWIAQEHGLGPAPE